MQILHEELKNKGSFYIAQNGRKVAEMSYSRYSPEHVTIDHTEVDDVLKGKGAGKKLVTAAVAWARQNNIRITPACTFAHSLFQKIPDFQDVWERD